MFHVKQKMTIYGKYTLRLLTSRNRTPPNEPCSSRLRGHRPRCFDFNQTIKEHPQKPRGIGEIRRDVLNLSKMSKQQLSLLSRIRKGIRMFLNGPEVSFFKNRGTSFNFILDFKTFHAHHDTTSN